MRTFRAYFNKRSRAPWSIDEGSQDSEINVVGFVIPGGCLIESRYNGEKPNDQSPVAWLEIKALGFSVNEGTVHFIAERPHA